MPFKTSVTFKVANRAKSNNVCKICEFMTKNDYAMNIQFLNFYCSNTKLTANIVQGLCLYHIWKSFKQKTNFLIFLGLFCCGIDSWHLFARLCLRIWSKQQYFSFHPQSQNLYIDIYFWSIFLNPDFFFLNWSVVSRTIKVWLQQLHVKF